MTDSEMHTLTEAIKEKYGIYRLAKPGKYPALKFNSYPAPYEHLQNSIKEELTRQGQADMQEALAAIPSIKTLAKIFHEGYILKDEKVLNTFYLYAWGQPRDVAITRTTHEPEPTPAATKTGFFGQDNRYKLLLTGTVIVATLLIYLLFGKEWAKPQAHGLRMHSPTNGDTVPRVMLAEGKVANANTVWIVIRPIGRLDYYVQAPIRVADDGTWQGPIYIGGPDKAHIGVHAQVRAFVNPIKPLIEDQVIYAWPKAELASDTIEVIRGTQDIQPATP